VLGPAPGDVSLSDSLIARGGGRPSEILRVPLMSDIMAFMPSVVAFSSFILTNWVSIRTDRLCTLALEACPGGLGYGLEHRILGIVPIPLAVLTMFTVTISAMCGTLAGIQVL
jgi:hypothetical protein